MYYPMYFDPTYILVLAGVAVSMIASAKMRSTFNRYSTVRSRSGMTGRDTAERLCTVRASMMSESSMCPAV